MAQQAISESAPDTGVAAIRQFLTFQLAEDNYGIEILDIREIIEHGSITAVPMMPDFIAGVINLRGAVVPVINLSLRFGLEANPPTKRTSIVIIEIADEDSGSEVGIIVDQVHEVLDIASEDIAAPPTFGAKIRADFISGMGKVDEVFLILLDVKHVLSIAELSAVKALQQAESDLVAPTDERVSETL